MQITRLATRVSVHNPTTGKKEWFGPEDGADLPDWVKERVTNPDAWETVELDESQVVIVRDNTDSFDDVTKDDLVKVLTWLDANFVKSQPKPALVEALKQHLLVGSGARAL